MKYRKQQQQPIIIFPISLNCRFYILKGVNRNYMRVYFDKDLYATNKIEQQIVERKRIKKRKQKNQKTFVSE